MRFKQVIGVLIVFIAVILIGGVVYQQLEGWRFLDAVYFAAMTVITVGYGDLIPSTDAGKIFTIFFALAGIAMVFYVLTTLGKYIFHIHLKRGKEKEKKSEEKKVKRIERGIVKKVEGVKEDVKDIKEDVREKVRDVKKEVKEEVKKVKKK